MNGPSPSAIRIRRRLLPRARSAWSVVFLAAAAGPLIAAEPYVQHENIVYGEKHGVGLLLDVFTPTGKPNGLAVIDATSGAWHSDRGKINDRKRARLYETFCERGYVMFAVRPGSRTKYSVPEMLENLNLGIRWVKSQHERYAFDRTRLGLTGASAGGHLAALSAVTAHADGLAAGDPKSTRVQACGLFFPATDFTNWDGQTIDPAGGGDVAGLVTQLLFPGGVGARKPEDVAAGFVEISPALRVTPDCPPLLLYHGDADPLIPLQQSQALAEAAKAMGVECELIVIPGGGHPWPTIHEEVAKMADWFDAHLAPR